MLAISYVDQMDSINILLGNHLQHLCECKASISVEKHFEPDFRT